MEFPSPVISLAIEPKTKADQEKLGQGLAKLTVEDPTFQVETEYGDGSGSDLAVWASSTSRFSSTGCSASSGCAAAVGRPQVAYKETLTHQAESDRAIREADRRSGAVRARQDSGGPGAAG